MPQEPDMPQWTIRSGSRPTGLPSWTFVLAVVAHPDDESFGLGAVLDAFARAGTQAGVLCLTHGEATTVHGSGWRGSAGDLASIRRGEFTLAAHQLGVVDAQLRNYPDGALADLCVSQLAGEVIDTARADAADGLLVFDPSGVTGHPDHRGATRAALLAGTILDLPVLAWTIPCAVAAELNREYDSDFSGHRAESIDLTLDVSRERQLAAVRAHASQSIPTSVLWRRLELLGDQESLRWLHQAGAERPERGGAPDMR